MAVPGTQRTSPKAGVVMTEQSIRLSRNENGNRGWFRRAGTLVATGGIVLGSLVLTASGASAESNKPIKESTIKSECKSAGGTYGSKTVEGTNFSACHYKDNEGNGFSDFYLNGSYYSTRPW